MSNAPDREWGGKMPMGECRGNTKKRSPTIAVGLRIPEKETSRNDSEPKSGPIVLDLGGHQRGIMSGSRKFVKGAGGKGLGARG
jgi:hypothetical protein